MVTLPSPLPAHDLATIIHHSIVDSIGICCNILLIAAVSLRSPSNMRSYTVLIINCAFMDLISCLTMLLVMVRLIPAHQVLAYIYPGPCVLISGFFCHLVYTIMLAVFAQSLFLITASFAYRLYILKRPTPSVKAVIALCLLLAVPNIMLLTTFLFTLDDPDAVRAAMRLVRPEYDLDEYLLQGHANIYTFLVMFTISLMTGPVSPLLLAIFLMRRKILSTIAAKSVRMSEKTVEMHRSLVKVLTLQATLPIFYGMAVFCFYNCQQDIFCSPVQEHLIFESVSFMPLFAPLITLYCVKPYRSFVKSIISCGFGRAQTQQENSQQAMSTTRFSQGGSNQVNVI